MSAVSSPRQVRYWQYLVGVVIATLLVVVIVGTYAWPRPESVVDKQAVSAAQPLYADALRAQQRDRLYLETQAEAGQRDRWYLETQAQPTQRDRWYLETQAQPTQRDHWYPSSGYQVARSAFSSDERATQGAVDIRSISPEERTSRTAAVSKAVPPDDRATQGVGENILMPGARERYFEMKMRQAN